MSNLVKHTPEPLDSFADFDTSTEGEDNDRFVGALKGTRLKFTNAAEWQTAHGANFSGRELLAIDTRRTEVKWGTGNGGPVEVRELGPGDRYRDLKKLNADCPQSEWRDKFGTLCGPWEHQHVLELVDPVTMADYSFPTSTTGGTMAIEALVDSIKRMRQFCRDCVYPLVQLTHCPMDTRKWGWRERPHFAIKKWIPLGGVSGEGVKAVSSEPALLTHAAASVIEGAPTVSEPTLREEIDDDLPL